MITTNRLYATFTELCAIDSEPAGERLMADRMRHLLTELGFSVKEDNTGAFFGGNAGNIHATLEATGPGEALFFGCHLDRVKPGIGIRARIEGGYIVSDGATVLGADDVAGLAALLEALTTIREHRLPHPRLEIVLTVAEELALAGARHFDTGQLTARIGFILDAAGRVGEIIVQAPEKINFTALFHGRRAHAGFNPEQGISAIQMASAAIAKIPLLRIDHETTVNIGGIHASGAANIVPDRCELTGEARSLNPNTLRSVMETMTAIMEATATDFGGSVELAVTERYPAYHLPDDAEPARRAARAAEAIGVPPRATSTGGGSDANVFNSKGKQAVVLSCGYERAHTTSERIELRQLALLAQWVLAIMTAPP